MDPQNAPTLARKLRTLDYFTLGSARLVDTYLARTTLNDGTKHDVRFSLR